MLCPNKKLLLLLVFCLCICRVSDSAIAEVNALSYYSGLMEYYALYSGEISSKELEETYIVMLPEKYVLHGKDDIAKEQDINDVRNALKKVIPVTKAGAHEYSLMLHSEFKSYDAGDKGFRCEIVKADNFIDITPSNGLNNDLDNSKSDSIIAKGVLFGKVSRIKLFFINTEEFTVFKYPYDKAKEFEKVRTGEKGFVDRSIYVKLVIEILPKAKYWSTWKRIENSVFVPGMQNDYIMLARIKRAEIYADAGLKNKLSVIGETALQFITK